MFREGLFDEAENHAYPYVMIKHESKKMVRKEFKVPRSVYRPAMVVRDSMNAEMDKVDGPCYFHKLLGPYGALAPVRRVCNAVMKDLDVPPDMTTFVNYPIRFDCRESLEMLKGSGVEWARQLLPEAVTMQQMMRGIPF